MNTSGKTAYRLTEHGQVVVVDRRHLTNGAIVPNYVVDLYLPIVGYIGLGVLTMLYRFVNRGKHQLRLDLHKHAKVGRVGFRTLERGLDLLQECRIIDVTKPQGLDRRRRELSPPMSSRISISRPSAIGWNSSSAIRICCQVGS